MSLRKKTLLVLAGLLLAITGLLYMALHEVIIKSYCQAEEASCRQSVARVRAGLDSELRDLSKRASVWAYLLQSDDLVGSESIQSHLTHGALADEDLDLVAILDFEGKPLLAKTIDHLNRRGMDDKAFAEEIAPRLGLDSGKTGPRAGYVNTSRGMMQVAVCPIANRLAKPQWVVLGYGLNDERVGLLDGGRTVVKLHVPGEAKLPQGLATAGLQSGPEDIFIQRTGEEQIDGYLTLADLSGKPSMVVSTGRTRDIYQRGVRTIRYAMVILLISGVVLLGGAMLLMERTVLSGVLRLCRKVNEIAQTQTLSKRISPKGRDELARLTGCINDMVGALEQNHRKLQESEERYRSVVEDQEELICRFGPEGILTFVNKAYCNCLGRKRSELLGTDVWGLFDFEDAQDLRHRLSALNREMCSTSMESRIVRPDGQVRWCQWTLRLIFNNSHQKGGEFQGVGRDITDRKLAQLSIRKHNQDLAMVREDERRHMAKELHDALSQELVALLMMVDSARLQSEGECERELQQAKTMCKKLLQDVRQISHGLYPHVLEAMGLASALGAMMRELPANDRVVLDCDGSMEDIRLGAREELALFRVAQESLNNAIKHSEATLTRVALRCHDGKVIVEISDNGRGFDPDHQRVGGLGLAGMRDRIEAINGEFTIRSQPGDTVIRATVGYQPRAVKIVPKGQGAGQVARVEET